jgi:hypothetical protein
VQEAQRVKRACTLDCAAEDVAAKLLAPIDEAMLQRWECDAHYFQYHLDEPEEIPGLAKTVLPLIRDRGGDLLMDVVSVDIDTDPHEDLTEAGFENLLTLLEALFSADTGLPQPSFFYTTKGGARLVWKLLESIPVDEAEPYIKGLIEFLAPYFPKGSGFELDTNCWDWTRVFRLPQVTRDGARTWEHPLYTYLEGPKDERLDLKGLVSPIGKKSTPIHGDRIELPLPTPEEVEKILYTNQGGKIRTRLSEWTKEAKHRLKGRECAPLCFDGEVLPEGNRDSGIQQMVGQACGLLAHLPLAAPEKIYALFYDSISALAPDESTTDWTLVLWRAVLKYWGKEQARLRHERQKNQVQEKKAGDKLTRIIEGMQSWCDHPLIHNEDEDVRRLFALEHLLCACGRDTYVMGDNGYYNPIGTTQSSQVPGLIKRLKMDDLIQLNEMDGNKSSPVPYATLFARHGTIVRSSPTAKLEVPGYHIQDIDGEEATLMIDLYRRSQEVYDTAAWHPEVDKWLRHLVSSHNYPKLESWIAHALAFDEGPIAALSLAGPPGIGKQLLAQGLAECINTEQFATAREFGRFREKLLHTPFLMVNEGLPGGQDGVEDVADIFRHFVSGDALHIEVKGKSPISVYNPLRIIFTANNTDVIMSLAGHRSLTKQDQAALLARLVHVPAREAAARYLVGLGGREYTGLQEHWVSGPEGPSRYVVARHFMWMYKNRRHKYPRGPRFLVEGDQLSEFMDMMRTESGIAPVVIEAVVALIESAYQRNVRGLAIESGRVYVTNQAVLEKMKELGAGKVNRNRLRKTISGLMCDDEVPEPSRKKNIHGIQMVECWKELDIALLHRVAVQSGLPHTKLGEYLKIQVIEAGERSITRV